MRLRARSTVIALALLSASRLAGAQLAPGATAPAPAPHDAPGASAQVATAPGGPLARTVRAGIAPGLHGVAEAEAATGRVNVPPQPANLRRRGMPQMLIGGAAMLGGLIIGDDVGTVVALGGLGFGLYGLYLYLQ